MLNFAPYAGQMMARYSRYYREMMLRMQQIMQAQMARMREMMRQMQQRMQQMMNSGGCFVAGTLVWTAIGLTPIEQIKPGDAVLSRSDETHEVSLQRVAQSFTRDKQELVEVTVGNETITTTTEHPFWVQGVGWVPAKELKRGDVVVTTDDQPLTVARVRTQPVRGPPVKVYNFEVENTHTYFVSTRGVWVHNACPGGINPHLQPDPDFPIVNTPPPPITPEGGPIRDYPRGRPTDMDQWEEAMASTEAYFDHSDFDRNYGKKMQELKNILDQYTRGGGS